jgi:DUF4097 and DUF4098 domain-containing protein YvlB
MKTRVLIIAALVAATAAADAATMRKNYRVEEQFSLRAGGALVVENPVGNIEIIGGDYTMVDTVAMKTVIGVNEAALEEGRQNTALIVGGDDRTRVLRAAIPMLPSGNWSSRVTWRLKVPRSIHVRVISNSSDRIRVADIDGTVMVKNVNGEVALENVKGAVTVESVNGSVIYSTPRPTRNATLSTVNGNISIRVRPDVDFRVVAETVKGDITTNLPARGAFFDTTFRGSVNAPGGPTISAGTLMGSIELLSNSPPYTVPESLVAKYQPPSRSRPQQPTAVATNRRGPSVAGRQDVKLALVEKSYTYATSIGDVLIQEIRGNADIFTGAGQVQLGAVHGSLKVRSHGGPLRLGEIMGTLIATTTAGDIFVDASRRGGEIATQGGTIRLLYTSGPTRLISGGGDITVSQAAGPIIAETRSGDVSVTMHPVAKSHPVSARTEKGNVVIHFSDQYSADLEATILTSDPAAHMIKSDIPGLSISREQVGDKTRIRATGKINGGGDRMVLEANDGGIRLTRGPVGPTVVPR